MALKVGELFATLGLDGKGFYKGLDKAETSLSNLSKKMAMTGAGLTLGLTAPLVKLGKEVFGAAADYESAFAGVRKTTDATEAEYAQLSKGIIDMSKQLPMAATGIAGVAEVAGQLGIEKGNLLDFTKIMIDLGESTDLTATDAATAFAKIAAVTGMTADEYSRLGSAVVGLGNSFPTTESAITEIMQRLAGTSAVLNIAEADMAGFATAISAIGMEAQAGGSSFSIFASGMSKAVSGGGKDLKKFAKVAGVSVKDFKKMFKEDASGAIQAFIEGLGKAEDPLKTLSGMGITEVNLQRMLLGLANGGDLLGNALDTANTEWEKNTALSDEAKKRYATMDSQLAMMKNSVMELGMEFGTALAPYVMAASDAIKSIADAFKTMSPETKDMIIKIALVAAAIGPATAALGGMFKGLSSVFGVMKFAMGPLGLIAGGLFLLYKLSPKVRAAFGKLGKFFGDFFTRIKNGRKPMVALRQSFISTFGKDAYNSIVGVLDKMGKAWEDTVGWFEDTGKGLTDAWGKGSAEGGFFGGLAESAKYLFPRLKETFQAGWATVSGAAKTLGSKALAALGTALKDTTYFSGLGAKLIEAALALQEGESIDFGGLYAALVAGVSAWYNGTLLPWVQRIDWAGLWQAFWDTMTNVWNWITDKAVKLGGLAWTVLEKVKAWGADTLLPWLQGIKWGDVWQAFWNVLCNVAAWVGSPVLKLGPLLNSIVSQLRTWKDDTLMPWLSAFDWSGLQKTIIDGIFAVKETASGAAFGAGELAGSIVAELASALGIEFGKAPASDDAKNGFVAWCSPIIDAAYDVGTDIVASLMAGILAGFGVDVKKDLLKMLLNPQDAWKLYSAMIQGSAVNLLTQAGLGSNPDVQKQFAEIGTMYADLKKKYPQLFEPFLEPFLPAAPTAPAPTAAPAAEVPVEPTLGTGGDTTGRSALDKLRDEITQGLVGAPIEVPVVPVVAPAPTTPTTPTGPTPTGAKPDAEGIKKQILALIASVPDIEAGTGLAVGESFYSGFAKALAGIDWANSGIDWSTLGIDVPAMLEGGFTPEESDAVIKAFQSVLEQGLLTAETNATTTGANITSNLATGMTSDTSTVTTAGNTVGTSALTGVTDKLTDTTVKGLGTDFAKGIAGGIADSTYLITAASTAAATAAMNAIKKALGIASPSKVGINLGGFFGKGFALGIEGMRRTVGMASSGLARFAASGAVPASSRLAYAGTGASGGVNVPIDYSRLARAIEARPAVFNINDRAFARATTDANAAAQARRQARINAGYGGR